MTDIRILVSIAVICCVLTAPRPAQAQSGHLSDQELASTSYPSQVSHRPGTPQKPLIERPGDRNVSKNPDRRYQQSDIGRAGCPQSLSKVAAPSVSAMYSAGYAGGSTNFNSPHSRPRSRQEGTWGLDYTLWGQPKLAWLRWGDGSRSQANGNFETDR